MRKPENLIGNKYGKLTVIAEAGRNKRNQRLLLCLCDCGKETTVFMTNLKNGSTKSCGCLRRNRAKGHSATHGMSGTRFYGIWAGMLQRCNNPLATGYELYGGRGISVCERWHTFDNFRDDMYAAYTEHAEAHGESNTSVDRIDSNGNYEASNCRWATHSTQNYNRRPKAEYKYGEQGIRFLSQRNRWQAYAYIGGKIHNIGYYATKGEAISAKERFLAEKGGASA